jgi:serine/threonine-protein kinase RsbW
LSWSGPAGCGPGHDPSPPRVAIDRKIPSDVRQIEGIVAQVARACEAQEFSPRHVHLNIPVALTEALSNAILYGNGGDESKTVRVRATVDDCALVIEVSDEGAGFDLDACTIDPGSGHDLEREDGRGLFLMRRLMDRVERFSSDGNVVRLTLNRP